MENNTGLIYQKIPLVMSEVEAISKDRNNITQGYKFRGIDDVYAALHNILAKHKLFTVSQIMNCERSEKVTKSGTSLLYSVLHITYKIYAEDGSFVESSVVGEGMDLGDKASNKAMSVAHKYLFLQLFCIPTEDAKDPENDSQEVVPGQTSDPGEHVVLFGKFKGKKIKDINRQKLGDYLDWAENDAAQKGKPLSQPAQDLIKAFELFYEIESDVK